ncbi:MAG: amidohydrolase family protein [Alphaproteobacteria bacterium]|nr:amidohydrolase family protein [Alphaproteobacteria bacterium]
MQKTDTLIRNGIIITVDAERRILEDGAVALHRGRIAAVGPTAELDEAFAPEKVIDASRMIVLPGLIDGHAHAGHGLVKSLGAGRSEVWFEACEKIYTSGTGVDFWAAEAALAAVERLKAGVTCGLSLFGGGPDIMRTDDPDYGRTWVGSVGEVGIRGLLAVGPGRPPFPRTYVRWQGGRAEEVAVDLETQLATSETLIEECHGAHDDRIRLALATPVFGREDKGDGADAATIRRLADRVLEIRERHDLRLTQDGHRAGTLTAARALGFLGPWAVMSHAVDLTPDDIQACLDSGAAIVHNPSAVMSIRGRCPVPELIDAGVTVMIGSDGAAPDRGYDMFRHMAQCVHYHRRHFRDATVLPPGKALEMVTIDAARGLGLADEIGSLEPGKRADVVLIDAAKPHLYPLNMPLTRVVQFANAADVDTVIVDGKVLMRGRQVISVDEAEVLAAAERECALMLERTGLGYLTEEPAELWGQSRLA